MKKFITFLGLKHHAIQYRWGRSLLGGFYFLTDTALPMSPFWSEKKITSCQAIVLETEWYPKPIK
jgi:hypothetical protein